MLVKRRAPPWQPQDWFHSLSYSKLHTQANQWKGVQRPSLKVSSQALLRFQREIRSTLPSKNVLVGARGISVVRAFAHCEMGRRIDPAWHTH